MIKEILGVVEKAKTRPLLIALLSISMVLLVSNESPFLKEPLGWHLLAFVLTTFVAFLLVISWAHAIIWFNSGLSVNDPWNWGVLIGSTMLTVCLHCTFTYFAHHPNGITFQIFGEREFIWLLTGYLASIETIRI
jgi:hypothetical protein